VLELARIDGAASEHRHVAKLDIVLSAIELVGFLVFALSIVTAAPEEAFIRVSRESAPENARQPRLS
jgi:hypothetical protein